MSNEEEKKESGSIIISSISSPSRECLYLYTAIPYLYTCAFSNIVRLRRLIEEKRATLYPRRVAKKSREYARPTRRTTHGTYALLRYFAAAHMPGRNTLLTHIRYIPPLPAF